MRRSDHRALVVWPHWPSLASPRLAGYSSVCSAYGLRCAFRFAVEVVAHWVDLKRCLKQSMAPTITIAPTTITTITITTLTTTTTKPATARSMHHAHAMQ